MLTLTHKSLKLCDVSSVLKFVELMIRINKLYTYDKLIIKDY